MSVSIMGRTVDSANENAIFKGCIVLDSKKYEGLMRNYFEEQGKFAKMKEDKTGSLKGYLHVNIEEGIIIYYGNSTSRLLGRIVVMTAKITLIAKMHHTHVHCENPECSEESQTLWQWDDSTEGQIGTVRSKIPDDLGILKCDKFEIGVFLADILCAIIKKGMNYSFMEEVILDDTGDVYLLGIKEVVWV